jgi:predicted ferric reductase
VYLTSDHVFSLSKPFVITAIIMLLIGSVVGSFWMMAIFGVILPEAIERTTSLHTFLQFDGFITLIVMGISYLIIPRFRNISIPSVNIAYTSYALIIISIIFICSDGNFILEGQYWSFPCKYLQNFGCQYFLHLDHNNTKDTAKAPENDGLIYRIVYNTFCILDSFPRLKL